MTVRQIFSHFLEGAPWVEPGNTADGIEIGPLDREVTRVGVGWSACLPNLRAAAEGKCDLFITHEPCFCEFWEPELRFRETEWGRLRSGLCRENGMALMALHDTWDGWPVYGIRDSWAALLGLRPEDLLERRSYGNKENDWLGLYQVPETTVDGFALHVAEKVRQFGGRGVAMMGDGDGLVHKVAVGTGCGIPTFEMLELGADVLVQVFDRAYQTFTRLPLLDLGANAIVLEHGLTEMPGMRNMARYLTETFPTTDALFFCNEPLTRFVEALQDRE